jgi:hypothetical protein
MWSVSRATAPRRTGSTAPGCPDVLDAPGSADPSTPDRPPCPSSADSFRACHIQCHPYWAQHVQRSSHAQQLARTSLSSTQVAFQRSQRERFAQSLPQSHQIDDSTFGAVDSDRFARCGLNRRESELECLIIEAEDLCRRIADSGRPLGSPNRDLDSRWKLVGQIVDDKSRYAADNSLRNASPNREQVRPTRHRSVRSSKDATRQLVHLAAVTELVEVARVPAEITCCARRERGR